MTLRHTIALVVACMAAAAPAHAVSFARADTNRDGAVTFQEAHGTMPKLQEIHFGKCDRDGDGILIPGEFACLDSLYSILRLPND